jgi:hypothetical protein
MAGRIRWCRASKNAPVVGQQGVDQHEAGARLDVVEQVDAPGNRGPAQAHREEHDQDQAPPEDRHRVARQGDAHDPMVEQRSSLECRDHPGQQAQDAGEQQGGHGQFQGRREERGELGPDALTRTQGFAEIAVGQLADVVQVLGIQRLVQAKAFHCLGVHFGVDPRSPIMTSTGSPGIMRINAKVSKVMPKKVGINNPSRRAIKLNILWCTSSAG